LLKRSLL